MNEKRTNRELAITGFIWRFLERCGAQGVSFVVSIVLARLLDPTVYGTVALVTAFTTILQTFIDGGMGNALVQKKNADDIDFSSVFYFNILMCALIYCLVFLMAPIIANFYRRTELTAVIRVLSLTLIISGVKSIQQAYVSRKMLFKRFFFATLIGTIVAAIVGIILAYRGFGVWALVTQYLLNTTIDTIVLWITVKWRPIKAFSVAKLRELFSYGWKLLMAQLIDRVYNQLRTLIIGRVYSASELAYYNKGEQYPGIIVENIDSSIDSILLPSMSSVQDDICSIKHMTRQSLQLGSYLMMPMLMGLAVIAEPIIRLMLTEKWIPCVPYLRVFCFIYALRPLNTANLNAIKALGRSDLVLKLDIIKKSVGIFLIVLTLNISVFAMAVGLAVSSVFCLVVNSQPNRKLLGYTAKEQLSDMLPSALLTCVMGAAVYSVSFLGLGDLATLLIQVPVGVLIYILLSKLFHIESFQYILEKILPMLRKQKKSSPDNALQS